MRAHERFEHLNCVLKSMLIKDEEEEIFGIKVSTLLLNDDLLVSYFILLLDFSI